MTRISITGKSNNSVISAKRYLNWLNKHKYPGNQAFTLIELIVVISLISIVLAFALPRIDTSFISNNERTLSSWLLLNVKALKEKALQDQTLYALHVDLDNNRMWTSSGQIAAETETEPETETAKENEYALPSGYRLRDVEFPGADKITREVAVIHFYKKGYSDKALIHIEDDDNIQYSYLIEPFLPHVKIIEKYIEF